MKLAYGIFYTKDIAAASKFYAETVGLEKAFGDHRFVAFKIGDALLGIQIVENPREIPGHQTIIIEVPNIHELNDALKAKGLGFAKELTVADWGTNLALIDPDGNKIEFFQRNIL
ncbi:MAG: Glyoxalase-like domain protein [Candidatus Taylorbacteria bacterium]|nr:Glyoxalase-like domain protein [Candidatus Taylorbacteria bacterium]